MEHQHRHRFRRWKNLRGDRLTSITLLGDSSRIAAGSQSGELKIFNYISNNVVDSFAGHDYPLTVVQSNDSSGAQLVLSSSPVDVRLWDARLWDASSVSADPSRLFDGCKTARFTNSGTKFAALSTKSSQEEIMLYDVQTSRLDLTLTTSLNRGPVYSPVHFNPSDTKLLWNGVLWDSHVFGPVHRFDQSTDCGGGGFHPTKDYEVIINSGVWDMRTFRLLQSVPSLDQTVIKFNARGDVIYAILRRDLEDVSLAFHPGRVAHPLSHAFRTVDANNYSDIATIHVDRCVLDLATEPTDSFVGLVSMDERMNSTATVYQIVDDDSDPDDDDGAEPMTIG